MSEIISSIFGWLGDLGDSPLGMLISGIILGAIGLAGMRFDDWLIQNNLPFADLVAIFNLLWFGLFLIGGFLIVVGIILIIRDNFG